MIGEFTTAVKARLMALLAANSPDLDGVTILVDDAKELSADIEKSMNEVGLTILIGQPDFRNNEQSKTSANMMVTAQLGIGEVPTMWRTDQGAAVAPDSGFYDVSGVNGYSGLVVGREYRWQPGAHENGEISVEAGPLLDAAGIFTATEADMIVTGANNAAFTGKLFLQKPKVALLVDLVAAGLQGFLITGFQKLRVKSVIQVQGSKTRQLWEMTVETQGVVQETS